MKRLFIAINLPEDIKKAVENIINDLKININQRAPHYKSEARMRFLPRENWHLTISFLGGQPVEAVPFILKSIEQTAKNYSHILRNMRGEGFNAKEGKGPRIEFEKIILAPPQRPPRMIWLMGSKETSKILGLIKVELEDELAKNGVRFQREDREYNAHLTLARFQLNFERANPLKSINFKEVGLSYIENLSFTAQSLDLMESHLKQSGAEYEILTKVDFI